MQAASLSSRRSQALHALRMNVLPEAACVGILLLMTTQTLGPLIVVAELALLAGLIAIRPIEALNVFVRWWPILLTPIIAVASVLWSDLPAVSARYGVQLLITCYVGVFLATLLPPHRFMAMLYVALFVFCLLSIASGNQGPSSSGPVLIGLTGAKNQMAYAGFYLFAAAVGCAFERKLPPLFRMSTLLAIPTGLFIVATTHAATAALITAASILFFPLLAASRRISPAGRIIAVVVVLAMSAPLLLITADINNFTASFVTDVLGKDPTLTGRTYLWDIANDLISRRPLLGYGYMSIWMGETADTLGILRWAGFTDGRVFHFHNTFLQIGVDTGYLGMVSFIILLVVVSASLVSQAILAPTNASSFFLIVFLTMLVRTPAEIMLMNLQFVTVFLYAIATYALWWRPGNHEAPTAPLSSRRFMPGPATRTKA